LNARGVYVLLSHLTASECVTTIHWLSSISKSQITEVWESHADLSVSLCMERHPCDEKYPPKSALTTRLCVGSDPHELNEKYYEAHSK